MYITPPSQAPAARPVARRSVVVKAQKQEQVAAPQQFAGALAATALALTVGLAGDVQPAAADVAGLTPCSQSKAYNKLERKELKTIDKRLKKVGFCQLAEQERSHCVPHTLHWSRTSEP